MPQETNLNISPYFDDFSSISDSYKVLFKPGFPVQARELTTLQSILQNQIETFGSHIFKDGSIVIPGNILFKNDLSTVVLEKTFQGIPSDYYFQNFTDLTIRGQNSRVLAKVDGYLTAKDTGENPIIFVTYISPSPDNPDQKTFLSGENLIYEYDTSFIDPSTLEFDEVEPSNISFSSGESFATVKSTYVGSSVFLEEGVFFVRGHFISVPTSVLYLNPYIPNPSARVGFRVYESIRTAFDDSDLFDNSQGFSNYSAPGADRFIIYLKLEQVPFDSTNEENFVELMQVLDGQVVSIEKTPEYEILSQEFARRTYEESGDYYVKPPNVSVLNSLNDLKGNNGVFGENQLTYNNQVPSDDIGLYSVSPFKAYVKGYEVESIGTQLIDFEKPRNTNSLLGQSLNYYTGPTYTLNRVYGSPNIGIGTDYYVSLRDSRVGSLQTLAPGKEIGLARVYDFALESGTYATSNQDENQWDISLYDLHTYTEISLNEPITLNTPTHVRGKESGAVGFLRYDVSAGVALTVYDIKGRFSLGEKLIFDDIENSRVTRTVRQYGTSDVKSIYGIVGSAYTFTADTVLVTSKNIGQVAISSASSGISTVTSLDFNFVGVATIGNIVAFTDTNAGLSTISFAKIESVISNRSITISGVTSVTGICDGNLPSVSISPSDFRILSTNLQSSVDNTLYTKFPKKYISQVDLTNSHLTIRKQYYVNIVSNSVTQISGDNETFLPFDEERYTLTREDGATEVLTVDKFTINSNSLTISGLSADGPAKLIATLRKTNVTSKIKNRNKVKSIIVDKSIYSASGTGSTTLNDGLIYGESGYPYGTRVQDREICLLEPEVTKIYGIFESSDASSNPKTPRLTLSSLNGPTNKTGDLLIGEHFVGSLSNSKAIYIGKIDDSVIEFADTNQVPFIVGEVITFEESGIKASISSIDIGDQNITASFALERNQKDTIYDYSKIVRYSNRKAPTRKIRVIFESAGFSSSDTGDLTTINSYDQFDYSEIGTVSENITLRKSDILDIRPRVSNATSGVSTRSPFEFLSRSFTEQGNSASNVLASDESILLDYSYYLPRIDKISVDSRGSIEVTEGISDDIPIPPIISEDSLEIATITHPPYLFNVNDSKLNLNQYKRYRMSDIGRLETRIENLENYTTLSLLETNTSNLQIIDENGLDRFKSGFFVDNFKSKTSQSISSFFRNSIDIEKSQLKSQEHVTSLDLLLATNSLPGVGNNPNLNADFSTDTNLIGAGAKRTGQLITLDYIEENYIKQPYATRTVSVSPYSKVSYEGKMTLYPSSDSWVEETSDSSEVLKYLDSEQITEETITQLLNNSASNNSVTFDNANSQWIIGEQELSRSTSVVADKALFCRSRNIQFTAKGLTPNTLHYAFFDSRDVKSYIIPKLLEISMTSGKFEVGELVIGSFDDSATSNNPQIKFRVAQANHKYGDFNSPSEVYERNIYNPNEILPTEYGASSTILNVDTYSLSNQPQGEYYGYVAKDMILRGQASGAQAKITNIRLHTDNIGNIIGSFFIPDPKQEVNPKFNTQTAIFRLTDSETNAQISGVTNSSAQEKYLAQGTIKKSLVTLTMIREFKINVEPPPPPPPPPSRPSKSEGVPITIISERRPDVSPGETVSQPQPPAAPTPTTTYFNWGTAKIGNAAATRLKEIAKTAGINPNLIQKIEQGMDKNVVARVTQAINNSSWASTVNTTVTGRAINPETATTRAAPVAPPSPPVSRAVSVPTSSKQPTRSRNNNNRRNK